MTTEERKIPRTRPAFKCGSCGAEQAPKHRRATVKGVRICWPCAEPFKPVQP